MPPTVGLKLPGRPRDYVTGKATDWAYASGWRAVRAMPEFAARSAFDAGARYAARNGGPEQLRKNLARVLGVRPKKVPDSLMRASLAVAEAGCRAMHEALVPGITENLADQIARIVRSIRTLELKKAPSVSETIDWAKTLLLLNVEHVDAQTATDTVNILLKYKSDITKAVKEFSTNAGTFEKKA